MACVVVGSLVEVTDPPSDLAFAEVRLKPIEAVVAGDYVHDPLDGRPVRVARVLVEPHCHRRRLHQVGALRADALQWIHYGGRWTRIDHVAPPIGELCGGLVALVLEGGRNVRVDGVVCAAYEEGEVREVESTTYRRVRVRLGDYVHAKRMALTVG